MERRLNFQQAILLYSRRDWLAPGMSSKLSANTTNLVEPMDWQTEAQAALRKDVPFFVRGAVKKRVEAMAIDDDLTSVDLSFYLTAKERMAPK